MKKEYSKFKAMIDKETITLKKYELIKEYEQIKTNIEELKSTLLKTEGAIIILQQLENQIKE